MIKRLKKFYLANADSLIISMTWAIAIKVLSIENVIDIGSIGLDNAIIVLILLYWCGEYQIQKRKEKDSSAKK